MRNLLFLMALLGALPLPAVAAPKPKITAEPAPQETTFRVDVPRSELSLPPIEQTTEAHSAQSWLMGASTWAPDNFLRDGYQGLTALKRSNLPYFFGEVATPLARNGAASLRARFGAGYASLERSGPPSAGGSKFVPMQEVRLIQLRLGVEYETGALFSLVHPYAGFAALPTFAMASQSQFEGRVSAFGLGMEGSAGVRLRPRFLREFWSFRDGALGLGAHYVFGKVDSSSLRGLGAMAYLQVNL